jgi:hypothetical protein
MRRRELWCELGLLLGALLPGCAGCASYRQCDGPPAPLLAALPARLSETGLYAPGSLKLPGPGVRAYTPEFPLWSDGAEKRRWVRLPTGERIDSTDMDDWSFPVGTTFWKEFSLAGKALETRVLQRVGPGPAEWAGAAYLWDAAGSEAWLTPEGASGVAGTAHDVPSAAECVGCHGGRRSHVLGFSALQLAQPGLPLALQDLALEGWLTAPVAATPQVPGDTTERAALGYLHANCGHCHNRQRPPRGDGPRCYDPERGIDFWLPADPSGTSPGAATTTVPRFVTPGEPDDSRLIALVSRRGFPLHMPPLGSRQVDAEGVRLLREWVASLPAAELPMGAP